MIRAAARHRDPVVPIDTQLLSGCAGVPSPPVDLDFGSGCAFKVFNDEAQNRIG
jgi:hypothetical protein